MDKTSWVAGYAAALEFCADDESRMFWGWNSTPLEAAEEAWEKQSVPTD